MPLEPTKYNELFNSSYTTFKNTLNKIVKIYPNYKLDNNSQLYTTQYKSNTSILQITKDNIHKYFTQLVQDSNIFTSDIEKKNGEIKKLTDKNNILMSKLNSFKGSNFAANGEVTNTTDIYNNNLVQNIILLTIIGVVVINIKKLV